MTTQKFGASKSRSSKPQSRKRVYTLSQLVEDFLVFHKSQNHSPKTIEWHQLSLRYLLRFLESEGINNPNDLETIHLRRWVVWLGQCSSQDLQVGRTSVTPRSKRTLNTYARSVHAFCKWLFDEGHTENDVTDHFVLPKSGKPLIRILEEDEFARLLAACEDNNNPRAYSIRDQAILWILYDTGLRVSEITELTFSQFDLRNGMLLVHGKGDKERRIALGNNALGALRRYLDHSRPDFSRFSVFEQLFLGEAGPLTVRGTQQIILRIKRRSNITDKRVSAHIFRHTFAVRYLMLGGDPFSLQELLGHEDMETIKNYMHLNDANIQSQKRKFSPGDHVSFSSRPRRRTGFRD